MKTKKILSIVLAIAMMFTLVTINASAEGKTYTASVSEVITSTYSLTPENFEITASVNQNSIYALDGNSAEYTYEVISFTATYTDLEGTTHTGDYISAPEEFFSVIEKRDSDIAYVEEYNSDKEGQFHIKVKDTTLAGDFIITFADDGVFGILDYTLTVKGFSAPAISGGDLGIDLGGVTDAVKLPTNIDMAGTIVEFPTIKDVSVLSRPEKTSYTDAEKFDATGLQLEVTTTDNQTGTFTFNDANAYAFKFNPSSNEKLTTYNSEVISYLNGVEVLKTPVTVAHQWSAGPVNITTDKYSENKPGYHAIVCEGCGETHDAQPHTPKNEEWTYNNDQTFVANGTESNVCADCGTVLTRDTFGTADFNTAFADMHFIKVIFEYINVLLRFIGAAVE